MVLRNWFVNCFTLYLEFLLLYLLPHNAQHQHKSSQQVQLNKTLMNPIEHEMVIATPCYFGCKCKQLFLCLSKCQGSIFLPIHYRLSCVNMLGLFLTTTSLPPPVWTHISLLFVQTCVQFQLIVVLIGSVSVMICCFPSNWWHTFLFSCNICSSDLTDFFPFSRLFWSDFPLVLCLSVVHYLFRCQFCFDICRALILFSLGKLSPTFR